jgi:hypothetical protein
MNRFRSGLVPLFALLTVISCSSEPTDDLRGDATEIVASPSELFIEVGGRKTVEVGAVDAQGNRLQFDYQVTETGPGITVRRDSSFLPIFVDDSTLQPPPTAERFRFIVEGDAYTSTSFTVSAGGLDLVIPVRVVPERGIAATFDDDTVDLGQVVTLTAPAGTTFDETTFLTIGTDTLTVVSQDATTIAFIPPPSVDAPVTINNVTSASAPGTVFSPATQTTLVTPLIDTVDVTYSTLTPAVNEVVTMTSPDPLIDLAVDSIIFQGQIPGSREGDPQAITPSADSSSLTFITPPNVNGQATVVNFHFPGGYLRALPTRDSVVASPNIGTTIDATFDDTEPALLQPVTLTAPAGFRFDDTTNVTMGGNLAITQSVAADGSSVTVLPIPGSVGVASIDGVIPDVAPNNIVTMLSIQTITVPPIFPLEGTNDPATAPVLPAPGTTVDAGSFAATNCPGFTDLSPAAHCQVYKLSFAAPATFTYTLTGANAADLGLYFYNTDMTPRAEFCDAQGRASPPESCSISLPAGEFIMAVINFGPLYEEADADPPFIEVKIE